MLHLHLNFHFDSTPLKFVGLGSSRRNTAENVGRGSNRRKHDINERKTKMKKNSQYVGKRIENRYNPLTTIHAHTSSKTSFILIYLDFPCLVQCTLVLASGITSSGHK